jgi:hypothetical protein
MAFVRKENRGGRPAGGSGRKFPLSSTIIRWVAVPGAGVGLSLWLVGSMAGALSATSSLSSSSGFMPRVPREIAASTTNKPEKAKRLIDVALAGPTGGAHSHTISVSERFETVAASVALSPQKLAAAFSRAGMLVARHDAAHGTQPLKERFDVTLASAPQLPASDRFGQRSETERSSRLALALAGAASVELAYAAATSSPSADTPFSSLFVTPEDALSGDGDTDVAVFDDLPDTIPLPGRRPQIDDSPADKPQRGPSRRLAREQDDSTAPSAPKPAKRDTSNMLAYAKPDNPRESGGGLFGNLFSRSAPKARAGVAVYDISAATVTMPDGTRLEAHSGIGHMADNIKYVDQKMRGPTPPGTYKLTIRESLFHGVEAIRLTPTDGRNPYGRNGLLAHTEMLRGRPEQSNGCVAFKDYKRFLKAFKRGKITRMIVVPGRSRHSLPATTVADNGRGA